MYIFYVLDKISFQIKCFILCFKKNGTFMVCRFSYISNLHPRHSLALLTLEAGVIFSTSVRNRSDTAMKDGCK